MNYLRTLEEWSNDLTPDEMEVLREHVDEDDDTLSSDEVLEILIDWRGGLSNIYQVKSLVFRIYDVEL